MSYHHQPFRQEYPHGTTAELTPFQLKVGYLRVGEDLEGMRS